MSKIEDLEKQIATLESKAKDEKARCREEHAAILVATKFWENGKWIFTHTMSGTDYFVIDTTEHPEIFSEMEGIWEMRYKIRDGIEFYTTTDGVITMRIDWAVAREFIRESGIQIASQPDSTGGTSIRTMIKYANKHIEDETKLINNLEMIKNLMVNGGEP